MKTIMFYYKNMKTFIQVDEISVEKALYIKDKYFFSDHDYNIIRNIYLAKIPSLYKTKKKER